LYAPLDCVKKFVMNGHSLHLNRPVHLAHRDVFFEQAKQLVEQFPVKKSSAEQHAVANKAQALFQDARRHAQRANRSPAASDEDLLFADFLYAALDNTQSLAQMIRRQRSAESALSPLTQFLGSSGLEEKMSKHYRRCAAHILKGMLQILPKADHAYRRLQHETFSNMTADERTRYEKARKTLLNTEED
jgi:hypothetical protein